MTNRKIDANTVAGTLPQASRRYNLGIRFLRNRVRSGLLPAYNASGRWLVFWKDVERLIEAHRVEAAGHVDRRHARAVVADWPSQERASS